MMTPRRRVKAGRQRLGISTEFSFGALALSPAEPGGMDTDVETHGFPMFAENKCMVITEECDKELLNVPIMYHNVPKLGTELEWIHTPSA